jgi:hypothetical protein
LDQLIKSLTSKGNHAQITKRLVESTAPSASDVFAWDNELRGFGMRVKPSGLRSYIVEYRNAHGRSKRMTIRQVAADGGERVGVAEHRFRDASTG